MRPTVSIPRWSMSRRAPAYSAAFASWIARTSFWVIRRRDRPSTGASWRTYENVLHDAPVEGRSRLLITQNDVRRSEEHTSELQSHSDIVFRLLLEKKKQ